MKQRELERVNRYFGDLISKERIDELLEEDNLTSKIRDSDENLTEHEIEDFKLSLGLMNSFLKGNKEEIDKINNDMETLFEKVKIKEIEGVTKEEEEKYIFN